MEMYSEVIPVRYQVKEEKFCAGDNWVIALGSLKFITSFNIRMVNNQTFPLEKQIWQNYGESGVGRGNQPAGCCQRLCE